MRLIATTTVTHPPRGPRQVEFLRDDKRLIALRFAGETDLWPNPDHRHLDGATLCWRWFSVTGAHNYLKTIFN